MQEHYAYILFLLALGFLAHHVKPLVIEVNPKMCDMGDCYSLFKTSISRCKSHQSSQLNEWCSIFLEPGNYVISCTASQRPSSAQIEAPAVSLAGLNRVIFGGKNPGPNRPQILVDYQHGGCGAIVAANSSNVFVQNVIIDALRLPYTVATFEGHADAYSVRIFPENNTHHVGKFSDRDEIYQWDSGRWPWLTQNAFVRTQVVPYGAMATRLMPDAGLSGPHQTKKFPNGSVLLEFSSLNPTRSQLRTGGLSHFWMHGLLQSSMTPPLTH